MTRSGCMIREVKIFPIFSRPSQGCAKRLAKRGEARNHGTMHVLQAEDLSRWYGIAERGYHRACHEAEEKRVKAKIETEFQILHREERSRREHEKRRERKRLKRIAQKAGLE